MSKRGEGHIEVILAFILFVGFLIFGLYFFNPLDSKRVLDSSLSYATEGIFDNITTPIATYSVVIKETVNARVVELSLSRGDIPGTGIAARGPEGKTFRASVERGKLIIDRESSANRLIMITFGDFAYTPLTLGPASVLTLPENYSISSSEVKQIVGEKEANALKTNYDTDYVSLKKFLNIPGRVDFGFSLDFHEGNNISAMQPLPGGVEVFSNNQRAEVLKQDGTTVFADLMTSVW